RFFHFPDSTMDFHRYKISVGVSGALNVLLLVISRRGEHQGKNAACSGKRAPSPRTSTAVGNPGVWEVPRCPQRRWGRGRRLAKRPASSARPLAEGSRCELCPRGWLPFRDWCYWVSEEVKCWRDGCSDCRTKKSRMLVIRDQEEMEFIRNVTQETSLVWIGLSVKSSKSNWTWVDGSVLNRKLFRVKGNAENNSCGVIRKRQINSESCNAEFKWICQTEAILL
uniref:C-type lectin domain-containing protein n=1 Tax=Dromaius novaehollandiae TaxID=8790 RepID=A0A8C4K0R7_DRONO